MSDKEKMKKAFQNLKAPEDTLERVMETMRRKELRENMRSGQSARVGQSVRTKRLALTLTAVLVLALGCGSVYAVKGFSLGALFGQPDAKAELGAAQQAPGMGADIDTDMDAARGSGKGTDGGMDADAEVNTAFKISCPFAFENPYVENAEAHDGVDFVADRGTPVLAAADGKVRTAAFSASLGNYVVIDHDIVSARSMRVWQRRRPRQVTRSAPERRSGLLAAAAWPPARICIWSFGWMMRQSIRCRI